MLIFSEQNGSNTHGRDQKIISKSRWLVQPQPVHKTTGKQALDSPADSRSKKLRQEKEWQQQKRIQQKEFNKKWETPVKYNVTFSEFTRLRFLGKGAFGSVFLVKKDGQDYAMKCMLKHDIVSRKQQSHALNEKKILSCIHSKFIIQLHFAFQNNAYLFIVCDLESGGELFDLMQDIRPFADQFVRFYASQVLLALEYLHNLNIVHRDLKPENVLISADGYVKLADLGFAKLLLSGKRAWTFCGTPDYMAPEIILNKGYSLSVDWWSFGVFLYEMATGYPPFMVADPEPIKTFERIVSRKFAFPRDMDANLKSLINSLLQMDLSRRYGNLKAGVNDIKNHPYFDKTNFHSTYKKNLAVPWKPEPMQPTRSAHLHETLVEEPIDKYASYFDEF